MERSGDEGVASSGWGAVATLTASNVVARVALFGQAPFTDPAETGWEQGDRA